MLKRFLYVSVFGGLGGALNAMLCFARIPIPVPNNPDFPWLVVPAGLLHGAMLAAIPLLIALLIEERGWIIQFFVAPIVGWAAGYLSWIPLARWALNNDWSTSLFGLLQPPGWETVTFPFHAFGLVSLLYFLSLHLHSRRPIDRILFPIVAGFFGSYSFWDTDGVWYFAAIHGTIWGRLVGFAMCLVERAQRPQLDVV